MQPCPDELLEGQRFPFIKGHPKLLGTPYHFRPHGECGTVLSELLPAFSSVVDDIALIRSMWTDQFNHAPAELLLAHGPPRFGNASMGSWITYGLGSENQNLPGFVVLMSAATATRRAAKASGAAASCPPSTRACSAARRATRSCTFATRPACAATSAAAASMRSADLNEMEAGRVRRSRNGHADQPVRAGLPHAGLRPRRDGHRPRAGPRPRRLRHEAGRSRPSPTTASWPAGSSSAACATCSSSTGAGTCTARPATTTSSPACP